jgi:regulator of protease activity HflC (stomatin/prohibitin superfamily)
MDEQTILRHLLEVEKSASALVDDAQAEADRRVAENEKDCRARYDAGYAREIAALEDRRSREMTAVKAEYDREMAAYRESLDALPLKRDVFFLLAETAMARER